MQVNFNLQDPPTLDQKFTKEVEKQYLLKLLWNSSGTTRSMSSSSLSDPSNGKERYPAKEIRYMPSTSLHSLSLWESNKETIEIQALR